jgi:hypothetical protein
MDGLSIFLLIASFLFWIYLLVVGLYSSFVIGAVSVTTKTWESLLFAIFGVIFGLFIGFMAVYIGFAYVSKGSKFDFKNEFETPFGHVFYVTFMIICIITFLFLIYVCYVYFAIYSGVAISSTDLLVVTIGSWSLFIAFSIVVFYSLYQIVYFKKPNEIEMQYMQQPPQEAENIIPVTTGSNEVEMQNFPIRDLGNVYSDEFGNETQKIPVSEFERVAASGYD